MVGCADQIIWGQFFLDITGQPFTNTDHPWCVTDHSRGLSCYVRTFPRGCFDRQSTCCATFSGARVAASWSIPPACLASQRRAEPCPHLNRFFVTPTAERYFTLRGSDSALSQLLRLSYSRRSGSKRKRSYHRWSGSGLRAEPLEQLQLSRFQKIFLSLTAG